MKKHFCFFLSISLMISLTLLPVGAINFDSVETTLADMPYVYVATPDDPKWDEMTIEERYEASNVPMECVMEMSTQSLLTTVLSNPFLATIYAYDSVDEGIDRFRVEIPAVDELLQRSDIILVLTDYIQNSTLDEVVEGSREKLPYYVACRFYQYLLNESESNTYVFVDPITGHSAIYVKTPRNSNVLVYLQLTWADHGTTQEEVTAATPQMAEIFSAEIVGPENPCYNCHAYAWYSTTAKGYWMGDPSPYMTDGSYSAVSAPSVGSKVTYKCGNTLDHSGIITSVGSTVYVTSKWGASGVFRHTLTNNPYYLIDGATNLQYWDAN